MPDDRLFDSSSLTTPPAPRIETWSHNRLLTQEEDAAARREAVAHSHPRYPIYPLRRRRS